MKTLLVLAKHPGLPEAIRAVLDPEHYRVIHHQEVWAAEPLFNRDMFDACFLDADLTDVRPLRVIEQFRRVEPRCPIFIYASARQAEWEEEAYLLGVEHVFSKPIRARLLISLLERCWNRPAPAPVVAAATRPEAEPRPSAAVWGSARTLEVFRNFSSILTHSLQTESLLKQFLLLLREVINVNRAAIFLRRPAGVMGGTPGQSGSHRLYCACALGVSSALLEHFALSLNAGIGRCVHHHGRILKSGSAEARADLEIQKEFELLGVQIAIPILDRESLVGVAVFDGRLTGEFFANEELALIFHLLEGLGLAIKNSWLHDALSSNNQMMADVLDQLGSGCVVVARDLTILHSNKAARACFGRKDNAGAAFEFSDLPKTLAGKVYEALKSSVVLPPFNYSPTTAPGSVYRITIAPFKQTNAHTPNAVMLLVEDFTQYERSQQMEIEAANLHLIKSMAERLAHEIGNSLVPISTYQQLAGQAENDPETRESIVRDSAGGIRRISRLSKQMRFLAQDKMGEVDVVPVNKLIEEAFQEARVHCPERPEQLHYDSGVRATAISGNYAGLKHALSEVLLNALQSAPVDAPVELRSFTETDPHGVRWLQLEVCDAGRGFSPEAAELALEPFYTKRTTGLGLGLTVARKIIALHKGKLEILRNQPDETSVVRISLPLDPEVLHSTRKNGLDPVQNA